MGQFTTSIGHEILRVTVTVMLSSLSDERRLYERVVVLQNDDSNILHS